MPNHYILEVDSFIYLFSRVLVKDEGIHTVNSVGTLVFLLTTPQEMLHSLGDRYVSACSILQCTISPSFYDKYVDPVNNTLDDGD